MDGCAGHRAVCYSFAGHSHLALLQTAPHVLPSPSRGPALELPSSRVCIPLREPLPPFFHLLSLHRIRVVLVRAEVALGSVRERLPCAQVAALRRIAQLGRQRPAVERLVDQGGSRIGGEMDGLWGLVSGRGEGGTGRGATESPFGGRRLGGGEVRGRRDEEERRTVTLWRIVPGLDGACEGAVVHGTECLVWLNPRS